MILYSKLWQGLKFFSPVSLGPLCLQGNKFDLVRSSGDSARTLLRRPMSEKSYSPNAGTDIHAHARVAQLVGIVICSASRTHI